MKRITFYIAGIAALLFSACSNIEENDRLILTNTTEIKVKGDSVDFNAENLDFTSAVLVEDFTGQKCTWCPTGTRILTSLQEQYGEDMVIPVAIHSGGQGVSSSSKSWGLMTDLGIYYWDKNGFGDQTAQPMAVFNRKVKTSERSEWATTVTSALAEESKVALLGKITKTNGRDIEMKIKYQGKADSPASLQLWLLESGIEARQTDQGTTIANYIHNHVLREAINGNDGQSIAIKTSIDSLTTTYTIPDKYVMENCVVVAFTYDASGVSQVIQMKIDN